MAWPARRFWFMIRLAGLAGSGPLSATARP
jgi:hypothetical protein